MKWNVLLKNYTTGKLYAFNIFDDYEFNKNIETLIEREYDKERFLKELDLEAKYSFWAKSEWETIFTTWPPYIEVEELQRLIKEYHTDLKPGEKAPERIDVNLDSYHKIDVYHQLRANWDRFADYMWSVAQQ